MAGATILIPGIQGTTLVETYNVGFDTIWSGVQKGFESIDDLHLEPGGKYDKGRKHLIEPGKVEALAYGECVARLREELDQPVYIFRYDWRLSLVDNADALAEFVRLIKKKCATRKLNFVTHSMGGLLLLAWLKLADHTVGTVERAVMTVPPLMGSPEAAEALLVGQGSGLFLNSRDLFRKLARTCPAVYQLLAFYDGAYTRGARSIGRDEIWSIDTWQRRVRFTSSAQEEEQKERIELMTRHLRAARDFHLNGVRDLDALPPEDQAKFCILYGTGVKTVASIPILPVNSDRDAENVFDFAMARMMAQEDEGDGGDGTVPVASTARFRSITRYAVSAKFHSSWWNPFTYDDWGKMGVAGYHAVFLSLDKNISIVRAFLQGKPINERYIPGLRP